MNESDGFLGRWSRRKLEAKEVERKEIESTPPLSPPAAADGAAPADPDAITPEEIAALPPIETIDATTDITVFLRKGVPEFLRNAALSRAWRSDPAIRDFVNDARDYALDWNTPGGAPGYGPLTESDRIEEMVSRIFGDPEERRDSVSHAETEPSSSSLDAATHNEISIGDEPPQSETVKQISAPDTNLRLSSNATSSPQEEPVSHPQQNTDSNRVSSFANKRHGGAVPV
jgi:hypothetical protein